MHDVHRRTRLASLLLPALAMLGTAGPARPQDPCSDFKTSSWQFQWENDALSAGRGSDEHYTNGLLYSFLYHPECNPQWTERPANWLRGLVYPKTRSDISFGWEVGQNFFTPLDLSPRDLIEDDRPYAAWLYGGFNFVATKRGRTGLDGRSQHVFELQFGIVGPEAGGELVQKTVHEWICDEEPMGWDNQLATEPGLNLIYLWRKRLAHPRRWIDFVPHLGGAFGTIQIYGNVGGTLRLGGNISGFPVLQNRLTMQPSTDGTDEPIRIPRWEGWVFVGYDGRAVAHNLFLDGSTFRASHSVGKKDRVSDLKAGFSVRYRLTRRATTEEGPVSSLRLTYTWVRRSQEIEPLPAGALFDDHELGSASFSMERRF